MIRKESKEWFEFVHVLEGMKKKSNRQVLCLACWELLNYEQKSKHLKTHPSHEKQIVTSSKFASSWQFYSLALAHKKAQQRDDGLFITAPYNCVRGREHDLEAVTTVSHHSKKELTDEESSDSPLASSSIGKRKAKELEKERMRSIHNSLNKIESSIDDLKTIYANSLLVYMNCKLSSPQVLENSPSATEVPKPSTEVRKPLPIRRVGSPSAFKALSNPSADSTAEQAGNCEPPAKRTKTSP